MQKIIAPKKAQTAACDSRPSITAPPTSAAPAATVDSTYQARRIAVAKVHQDSAGDKG